MPEIKQTPPKNNINKSNLVTILIGLFLIAIVIYIVRNYNEKPVSYNYVTFTTDLESGKIKNVTSTPVKGDGNQNSYYLSGTLKSGEHYYCYVPTDEGLQEIIKIIQDNPTLATYNHEPVSSFPWTTIVLYGLLIGSLVFVFVMVNKNANSSNNKAFDFAKSRAKLSKGKNATFNDVAGCDEEKAELEEIIDFLKAPKKYLELGARIPKGVLLVGPPGTGKTLLARAVAGEANVPFYFISGSDFLEMFVGVGASRVRDMFKTAKQNAPCILFIDEIDAVGRQRGTGLGGGHDEREQTLNQLLVEMDGFGHNSGVIVIAATNRPDILDPALLRPGRFDRQVYIGEPDLKGRIEILKVHARGKKIASSVSFEEIARRAVGFTGADLENLLNEAALLAARENKTEINLQHIDEAIDRVMMGPAKKSKKYSEKEKRYVAFHEAGHAVIGIKLENASNVQKVTIIPRGRFGGYNLMLPNEESYLQTKSGLLETITGYLGGRVAEELKFGDISTGAHNDFQQATRIARLMVTQYGMSELGTISYEKESGGVFLGRDYNAEKNFSDQIALEIDKQIQAIINDCYEKAKTVINENMELLDTIAKYLIEVETLTKENIDEIVATGKLDTENILHNTKDLKETETKAEATTSNESEVKSEEK